MASADGLMPRLTHKHAFKSVMHMDGCHWYAWSYACDCGATLGTRTERDFHADPYSMVHAEPQVREVTRDEKGRFIPPRYEEVRCDRCQELQQGTGVRPRHVAGLVTATGHKWTHETVLPDQPDDDDEEAPE